MIPVTIDQQHLEELAFDVRDIASVVSLIVFAADGGDSNNTRFAKSVAKTAGIVNERLDYIADALMAIVEAGSKPALEKAA